MVEKILSVEPFSFTKDTSKPMNNGSATVPRLNLPPARQRRRVGCFCGAAGKSGNAS